MTIPPTTSHQRKLSKIFTHAASLWGGKLSPCRTTVVIACLLIVGSFYGCSNKTENLQEEKVVKIGVSLPLTGNLAFHGEELRNVALMALRDAGKTKYQYKLLFQDDAGEGKKAVVNASRFLSVDRVSALVGYYSAAAKAMLPLAVSYKIPLFVIAYAAVQDGEYIFNFYQSISTEAEFFVRELVKQGYKHVGFISELDEGNRISTQAVEEGLQTLGIKTTREDMPPDVALARNVVTKLLLSNPEIIFVKARSPRLEVIYKNIREQNHTIPVTTLDSFGDVPKPELFEGQWFVSVPENLKTFDEHYTTLYGSSPKGVYSQHMYELISFIIAVQENADKKIEAGMFPTVLKKYGDTWHSKLFGDLPMRQDGSFEFPVVNKVIIDGQVVTCTNQPACPKQ